MQLDLESDTAHVIRGRGAKLTHAIAGLLEELASRRILDSLARIDHASRQQPRAPERARGLLHDEDATLLVDAGDDRGHRGPVAHPRYGFLVGVGSGGTVGGRNVAVGVGIGVRGVGVGVGRGVGVKVGHGSGLTRFQV